MTEEGYLGLGWTLDGRLDKIPDEVDKAIGLLARIGKLIHPRARLDVSVRKGDYRQVLWHMEIADAKREAVVENPPKLYMWPWCGGGFTRGLEVLQFTHAFLELQQAVKGKGAQDD